MSSIDRMKELIHYGENKNVLGSRNVEYTTKGADGKTYGIVREGTKFYIKTAADGKEARLSESYDYIGGIMNKNKYCYSSYTDAVKNLEMKLMSLNEAFGSNNDVHVYNPDKRQEILAECSEEMRKEIARQREIMYNSYKIMNEDIGFKNIGIPEAPAKASAPQNQGEPFEEKGEAKLDKDPKTTASTPEKQGNPFEENGEVTDTDMQSDKNPKGGKDDFESAKNVPANAVAAKKPAGGKAVKMNEDVRDWGAEGLPETEGTSDTSGAELPGIMGRSQTLIGDDQPEGMMVADENNVTDVEQTADCCCDADECYCEMEVEDDVMSDDDFESLLDSALGAVANSEGTADDETEEIEDEVVKFESKKANYLVEKVMNMIRKTINEARPATQRLNETWFDANGLSELKNDYFQLIENGKQIKRTNDLDEVDDLMNSSIKLGNSMKNVIRTIRRGKRVADRWSNYVEPVMNSDDAILKQLMSSIDAEVDTITTIWDNKIGMPEDEKFQARETDWTNRRGELGYGQSLGDEEESEGEGMDDFFSGKVRKENRKAKKTVNEDELHVFGKHPGYRRKPMSHPNAQDDEPFGKKIGDGKPFNKTKKGKILNDSKN